MEETKNAWQTFTEEIEVAGHQLVDEVNRLIAEGNVRKLQLRSKDGDLVLNLPLTAGAVAGVLWSSQLPGSHHCRHRRRLRQGADRDRSGAGDHSRPYKAGGRCRPQ